MRAYTQRQIFRFRNEFSSSTQHMNITFANQTSKPLMSFGRGVGKLLQYEKILGKIIIDLNIYYVINHLFFF